MGTMASQITSLTIVYSTVYIKASRHWPLCGGIHRGPHKWPVTRKMFPFDDIMFWHDFCLTDWSDTTENTDQIGGETTEGCWVKIAHKVTHELIWQLNG